MKRILVAASEAVPFAKTGGLADVAGTLPRYINKSEYDVRVIMPKYSGIDPILTKNMKYVCQYVVNLSWRRQYAAIYSTTYKGIIYYFIDNEYYFSGKSLYDGNMKWDAERFAYFSKAILKGLPYMDWTPDVIHCNDWQTGLVPVFLHTLFGSDAFYRNIKTVISIHNLRFQGKWNIEEIMDITGLPAHIFTDDKLEYYGEANLLKGGLVYADQIVTVSPTYAKEIMTEEHGEGLQGLLSARKEQVHGILNGIDYRSYNPDVDDDIEYRYNADDVGSEKVFNKTFLQAECNMPVDSEVFTIGIVSRLYEQKGIDLIECVLKQILTEIKVQVYVLGTGEERYESMFRSYAAQYPKKLRAYIGYSDEFASKIYSSCDAFLMPSLFEPCGLSQMIAMRYGTLPIVRETGGLKDTVIPYNEDNNTGTGFSFRDYNAHDMLHVIKYASDVYYYHPDRWLDLQKRAMTQDFSWEASAREYEALYEKMTTTSF